MKTRTLKQLLLYNYRYLAAYTAIGLFGIYFLGWRLGSLPPGLSQSEIANAARSLFFSSFLNEPLYPLHSILQWASSSVFGISSFSLRLSSIILTIGTIIFLYHLLKKWFGKSTALLSITIFISADWLLYIARNSIGYIEFSFWLALAAFTLTKLLEHKENWLPLLALALGSLLFVPFGVYAVICLLSCLFGFVVFRGRFIETKLVNKVFAGLIMLVAIGLVTFSILKNPHIAPLLLGINKLPTITGYLSNLFFSTSSIVAIFPSQNPLFGPQGVLLVRFFELIFVAFGFIMLWRTKINRLNLILLITTLVLVLVGALNNDSRNGNLLLVPAAIFMTAGLRHLLHRWQRTFPKNPYARIAAFVPLSLLLALVVLWHFQTYFMLWPSQTGTHQAYNTDFSLLKNELHADSKNNHCLVQSTNQDLQKLLLATKPICQTSFISNLPPTLPPDTRLIVPGNSALTASQRYAAEVRALVSTTKSNSTRWLVISPSGQ